MIVVAAFEAPTVVAGFHDVAMVSQAVEQRGGHFGVAEHAGPLTEGKIGGDDDGCALVEPADEMEQQLAAGLGERQVAEFVEDDEMAKPVLNDAVAACLDDVNRRSNLTPYRRPILTPLSDES